MTLQYTFFDFLDAGSCRFRVWTKSGEYDSTTTASGSHHRRKSK